MWDVWEPDDIKRMSWDCIMLLTVVYLVIVTPYLIAFDISTVSVREMGSRGSDGQLQVCRQARTAELIHVSGWITLFLIFQRPLPQGEGLLDSRLWAYHLNLHLSTYAHWKVFPSQAFDLITFTLTPQRPVLVQVDFSEPVAVVDMIVNGILMTDLLLNFRTAFPGVGQGVV